MAITQLKKEKNNLKARIAAEVRPEVKKTLEDELVALEEESTYDQRKKEIPIVLTAF